MASFGQLKNAEAMAPPGHVGEGWKLGLESSRSPIIYTGAVALLEVCIGS